MTKRGLSRFQHAWSTSKYMCHQIHSSMSELCIQDTLSTIQDSILPAGTMSAKANGKQPAVAPLSPLPTPNGPKTPNMRHRQASLPPIAEEEQEYVTRPRRSARSDAAGPLAPRTSGLSFSNVNRMWEQRGQSCSVTLSLQLLVVVHVIVMLAKKYL
jgi:hypothetical protein